MSIDKVLSIQNTAVPEYIKNSNTLNWAMSLFSNLTLKHFYGKVTFIMEDGKILRIIKEETLKP